MGIVRDIITPILPAARGVEFRTVSAEELRRMDDAARKREQGKLYCIANSQPR